MRNTVTLIGRLGIDPEIKETANGKTLARISIATNSSYKNQKGEKVEDTQWHNVVAWNHNATFAEKYLQKGKEVMLEGRLVHRSYEDKDGNKRYSSEVVANEFLLLGSK